MGPSLGSLLYEVRLTESVVTLGMIMGPPLGSLLYEVKILDTSKAKDRKFEAKDRRIRGRSDRPMIGLVIHFFCSCPGHRCWK